MNFSTLHSRFIPKLFFYLFLMTFTSSLYAHSVQVGYCILDNGAIRVYTEHWHGDMNASGLAGAPLNVTMVYGGLTENLIVPASGFQNNATWTTLDGCGAGIITLGQCGSANTMNDFLYWDFLPAVCGEPLSVTINTGTTVITTEECSTLFPQTITGTFVDNAPAILTCDPVTIFDCNPIVLDNIIAVDDCDPNPTITYVPAVGQPGTQTVTASVTDNVGQTSTCTFSLSVVPPDRDGDGYEDASAACGNQLDCDDNNASVYPGAPELCDNLDNDCDGNIPDTETDDDGDGFSECQGDCDDMNYNINPGATEDLTNGIDDNCDGLIDVVPYCSEYFYSPCAYISITNVTLEDLNNSSTCSSGGYGNYTDMSASLMPGGSYSLFVTGRMYLKVYVDWNKDSDFNDAGELILGTYRSYTSAATSNFTVPSDASGSYRMRVSANYYNTGTCSYNYYGEVEDYTINTCQDDDGDGYCNEDDNCPSTANADQLDSDQDNIGDVCDPDRDNDGVPNESDPEPLNANACGDADGDTCDDCAVTGADGSGGDPSNDGDDNDGDGLCDAGDPDDDNDGVDDEYDSQPFDPFVCADADADGCDDCAVTGADGSGGDPSNDGDDNDGDGLCDAGDPDDDNDGVDDGDDNCQFTANTDQANNDGDELGDLCDSDDDNDGVPDEYDNCQFTQNPDQADSDCDTVGDACDVCPDVDDTVDNNGDGIPDCSQLLDYDDYSDDWKCGNNKILICHIPQGNPENRRTICISPNAMAAHFNNHGDKVGPCISCGGVDPRAAEEEEQIELHYDAYIRLAPVPAVDNLQVEFYTSKASKAIIVIYDMSGTTLETYTVQVEKGKNKLSDFDVSNLKEGIYFVTVVTKEGNFAQKFIKVDTN